MKVVAIVFVAALIVATQGASLTDEQKAKLKGHFDECVKTTQIDKQLIVNAKNGQFSNDPKLKAFFGCMFKKINFINEKNEIQIDVIKAKVPSGVNPADLEKVINACKDKKGADVNETSFLLYKCYLEKTPEKLSLLDI